MIREALSLLKRQFPRTSLGAFVQSQVEKLPRAAFVASRESSLPQEARYEAELRTQGRKSHFLPGPRHPGQDLPGLEATPNPAQSP